MRPTFHLTWSVALLMAASALACPGQKHYPNVQAYMDTLPGHDLPATGAYGSLTGSGRQDWVGVVRFTQTPPPGGSDPQQDYDRIIILTQAADGSYSEAARSPPIEWSSPTFQFDDVKITKGSAYISSSSSWHECGSSATYQFKLYQGQWRLIGARFDQGGLTEAADGSSGQDEAAFDRNVLTGQVIATLIRFGHKPVEKRFRIEPEVILLDDLALGFGWSKAFDAYLQDLNTGC